jgi:hypothetical protein
MLGPGHISGLQDNSFRVTIPISAGLLPTREPSLPCRSSDRYIRIAVYRTVESIFQRS